MTEMTVKELKETIKYYLNGGEPKTAERFARNYRKLEGFDYEKTINMIMEFNKKK